MSAVICEKRIAARVKEKIYKMIVRTNMTYGLATVALTKDRRLGWR